MLGDGTHLTGTPQYLHGNHRDLMPDDEYRERTRGLLAFGLSNDQVGDILDALNSLSDRSIHVTTALATSVE